MDWHPRNGAIQDSSTGHRITATRTADTWTFAAWGPIDRPDLTYWQWHAQACQQEHYRIGEPVPQRARLLGVRPTAAAARALCESDATDVLNMM